MSEISMTLMEAIARKKTILASYNGGRLKLAPHLLFERHNDLFVSALNLSKVWRADEEPRLGQFKLAGLVSPELLDETFAPLPGFKPMPPRPDDALLLAV